MSALRVCTNFKTGLQETLAHWWGVLPPTSSQSFHIDIDLDLPSIFNCVVVRGVQKKNLVRFSFIVFKLLCQPSNIETADLSELS